MKRFDDERYKKYLHIIYQWNETVHTNYCVRVYDVRNEEYGDQDFYVYGIGVSTFVECNHHKPDKEMENLGQDAISILKNMCYSCWYSLEDFTRLDKLLKDAGAKQVYLHPSYYQDGKEQKILKDEWLIIVQDE